MLARLKFEIDELVTAMLDCLPASVWTDTTTTFFDPSIGGGQVVKEIERRLTAYGHTNIAERVFGCESNQMRINYAVNKNKLAGQYATDHINNSYDVIVSNPNFIKKLAGGNNKQYNEFAKTSLDMLTEKGKLILVTPTSVLKKSKRFSVIGLSGLKTVDFSASKHLKTKSCFWVVDKEYSGPVTVKQGNTEYTQTNDSMIVDYTVVDKDFMPLYNALKLAADKPSKRMFVYNAVDTRFGRSLTQTDEFQYPVYKLAETVTLVQYNKPVPKFHNKQKLVVSVTKSFNEQAITVTTTDFDVNHACTEATDEQAENIKSFLLTDCFKEHCKKWKEVEGYGFNSAIGRLPKFDKNVKWTEDSVRNFLDSFLLTPSV
jgi:hypothetical protein